MAVAWWDAEGGHTARATESGWREAAKVYFAVRRSVLPGRRKLPTLVAINVFELIVERLRGWLPRNPVLPDRPVFVLDGSTLTLSHAPDLLRAYPPSRNQYGDSHWPIIRLVVLQDVQTGLALRPHWGPHHGPQAVGEQKLALAAIPHLSAHSVMLGDRNFGILAVAWTAAQWRHEVLLRLTRPHAEALVARRLTAPCEQQVCWKPTRFDRCGGPFPEAGAVCGRMVCIAAEQSAKEKLLFFLYDSGPTGRRSRRFVSLALECRNRPSLYQTNRAPATTLLPFFRDAGERSLAGFGRLQLGSRRDLFGH